ncbi:SAP domain protein [Cooperia oncophora]
MAECRDLNGYVGACPLHWWGLAVNRRYETISLEQKVIIRRLSDYKVQELKNECKKRQLPVSGAKPQLLERLRPFEKAILGVSPPLTPEPVQFTNSGINSSTAVSSMQEVHQQQPVQEVVHGTVMQTPPVGEDP